MAPGARFPAGAERSVPDDIYNRKLWLAALVEGSEDAIISRDLSGVITSWNGGAQRLFGFTPEEAIGRTISLIVPPDLRDEEMRLLGDLRRGENIGHFETVRMRKDGVVLDISMAISPIKDAQGNVVGASKVARDITERKRTERALRAGEERFRALVEFVPECLTVVAGDGTLLYINTAGLAMTGADRADELVGRSILHLLAPEDRNRFRAFNERICRGERETMRFDLIGLHGRRRRLETHGAPLRNEDGTTVQVAVTRDITGRGPGDAALSDRGFSALLLLELQDEERRRIARELHDGVGQHLVALSLNTTMILREAATLSPDGAQRARENLALIGEVSKEIRTMSYLLHPPLLDESGLDSALEWYVQGFSERSGIAVKLDLPEDQERLPREHELCLFRIAQECLMNIHRHSGSVTARVRLSRTIGETKLEVSDDGRGIHHDAESKSGRNSGVGLRGMRERVRQLGGGFEIHSTSEGTRVTATLPETQRDEAATKTKSKP